MKRLIFFVIGCICYYCLYAQNIDQITSINYNKEIITYAQWNGAIATYNDRLFVRTNSSFHEFLILENGDLERIFHLDTMPMRNVPLLISEDRLFMFYEIDRLPSRHFMMIFDLSTVPLNHLETIEFEIGNLGSAVLDGDYIYISDMSTFGFKMNKNTYEIERYINGLAGYYDIKDDLLVRSRNVLTPEYQREYYIQFYDISQADDYNPFGVLINEINFSELFGLNKSPGKKEIKDGKLYVMCWDLFVVFDISDLNNIEILFYYSDGTANEHRYMNGIMYDDLFITSYDRGIKIFDISIASNPVLIHQETYYTSGFYYGIAVHDDKLYLNGRDSLYIIDLLDNFNVLSTFGRSLHSVSIKNGYITEYTANSTSLIMYSAIDDDPEIIVINPPYQPEETSIGSFGVFGDYLYLHAITNTFYELLIYSFPAGELQQIIDIPFRANYLKVFDDYIILSESGQSTGTEYNYIYQISENSLVYIGEFPGNMSHFTEYEDSEYLVYFYNNNVFFRDVNSPLSILHTYNIAFPETRTPTHHIKKGVICFENMFEYFFYSYDNDLELLTNIHYFNFPPTNYRSVNHFNGYSSVNGSFGSNEVVYYRSDLDGLYQIGNYEFEGSVISSYFFPEQNKLVVRKNSSIHLYDITYTTVDTEDEVLINNKPILFNNYPNPFNPSTTISYSLQHASNLRVDIYNIKGQKVKSLVNEHKPAGKHSVTWHGTDDSGNAVGSGIYFYRMEAEGYVETKKMVLMK